MYTNCKIQPIALKINLVTLNQVIIVLLSNKQLLNFKKIYTYR